MKNKRIHTLSGLLLTTASLWVCAALVSCSDKLSIQLPTIASEIELSRENHFYDISVPEAGDWHVTGHPDWAGPMNETGADGEKLRIFVEENGEDADRRDSIMVTMTDQKVVCLPLWQHGLLSDDDNTIDEAGAINDNDLRLTYGTGYSIDVIKRGNRPTMKYNISNKSPFNFSKLYSALQKAGEADALFSDPLFSSRYESVTGNSTSAIANQLSVNAGIEVGISAFKLSVEAGYSSNTSSNDRYMYAMQEIQHIVGSQYLRAGMLRYLAQTKADVFQSKFNTAVKKLEKDPADKKAMADIIKEYGTHVITRGTLGGELKISMQMKYSDESEASKIHAALDLSTKVVDVNGQFDMTNEEKSVASNTTLSLQSYGGKNEYSIAPGATFESFMDAVKDEKKMTGWVSEIKDGTALALIDAETLPIWDLMPTEQLRDNLRNYVVSDYQRQIYGNDFKADLYVVEGYDVSSETPGYGSIYIPEIDVQLDFERSIMPELSETELSTVVYSGPKGNVNRDKGFFVGSDTRKPCKFHRENGGSFSTEEFDRLSASPISELYVSVTGDVTIAAKTATDLYRTCTVSNWKYDLNQLKGDMTALEDMTVSGTTTYRIHIADGVALTLDGVNVNNQIVCDGNAKIILASGSTNSVSCPAGALYSAIQAGPAGTTLTIVGSGTVTATGGPYGAGIGSGQGRFTTCGDIEISGGTVTATGGNYGAGIGSGHDSSCGKITISGGTVTAIGGFLAAGIGSGQGRSTTCGDIEISGGTVTATSDDSGAAIGSGGYYSSCGNISISGGTVTAMGGDAAAAIGSGLEASCGDITIRKTVTKVTAKKGMYEAVSIGAGYDGSCGTVTIETGANVIQE